MLGKHCFGFDFDAPLGIEQRCDNHRGCGANLTEDLAVGAADRFPIFLVGNEHTGAVHVLELRSCLYERGFNDPQYSACLLGGGKIIGTHRAGAGHMDNVADAHST